MPRRRQGRQGRAANHVHDSSVSRVSASPGPPPPRQPRQDQERRAARNSICISIYPPLHTRLILLLPEAPAQFSLPPSENNSDDRDVRWPGVIPLTTEHVGECTRPVIKLKLTCPDFAKAQLQSESVPPPPFYYNTTYPFTHTQRTITTTEIHTTQLPLLKYRHNSFPTSFKGTLQKHSSSARTT